MLQTRVKHAALIFFFFGLLFVLFFSPVLFSSRILPSDGQMASFHSPVELWTNALWGGFPAAADPQYQSWYPLSRLVRPLPNGFNVYMTLAYVLASCFTYGYVFSLTRSRFSALVAGTIFGMSGFMMAHLGHTAMIHAILWLPLVFWSLEKLRGGFSIPWFTVAVFSSACNLLGGHPQIFVYTWALGMCYALFLGGTAKGRRLRYVSVCLAVIASSCLLAAIQIVPTFELSLLSLRKELNFADFVSFSLPPNQLIHLLFPSLFGVPASVHQIPYFGKFNSQELTGYIGILPLLLAAVGVWGFRRDKVALFWAATVPAALLLAVGDAAPLAKLLYHVPVLNQFRAPARHLLEFSFAVAVLAGLGADAVRTTRVSGRFLRNVVVAAVLTMGGALAFIYAFYSRLQAKASLLQFDLGPMAKNPAVIVPVIVFVCSILAFIFWIKLPARQTRQAVLWVTVLVNLAVFGWFYEWRYVAIDKAAIKTPFLSKYRPVLENNRQRVLALGVGGQPDMFRLYQLQSVGGYGPLMVKRYAELSGLTTWGDISPASLEQTSRAIDVLAVRYIFRPASNSARQPATTEAHGIKWSQGNLQIHIGQGCGNSYSEHVSLSLPQPAAATRIAIVSKMSCSTEVVDNAPILEVALTAEDGNSEKLVLLAGRDTCEWAYDNPVVRGLMKHRRATVFASWPFSGGEREWTARSYLSTFPTQRRNYSAINLKWLQAPGIIDVDKISLIDEVSRSTQVVVRPDRFEYVETLQGADVSRNLRAQPRVWLATEAVTAEAEQILATIAGAKASLNGRSFDPRRTALIEEPIDFHVENPDPNGMALITHMSGTEIEIQSSSETPAFLVMSDVYYPGWKASIDGVETHIFQTDYALRGIALPAGGHVVRLEFRPLSLYVGATVSFLTLIVVLTILAFHVMNRRRNISSSHLAAKATLEEAAGPRGGTLANQAIR